MWWWTPFIVLSIRILYRITHSDTLLHTLSKHVDALYVYICAYMCSCVCYSEPSV